jgi:hypothetical protein
MDTPADLQSPEIALACTAVLAAVLAGYFNVNWLGWWERPLARLAVHRRLALAAAALLPLILRIALLSQFPAPEPRVHDEFSFLVGASTLLEGRLANPSHPLWPHFESIHVLARPSYSSAFPLGQAAALAVGSLLGHPWIGIWVTVGAMCGCVCWMLQGWLPPRWAFLGAVLLGLRLGVSSYWMNSYWGGALAAAGGALVLGSLPRLRRQLDWRTSVILGIGLVILACTRAFEGAVFALAAAAVLLCWMLRMKPTWGATLRHVVLPLGILMMALAAGLGFHFARVTGSPFTAPYVLYRSSMTMAPHFVWQTPRPEPLYNNRDLRHFYAGREMSAFHQASDSPLTDLGVKAAYYWRFYYGPILTIPLFVLPLLWSDPRIRTLLWIVAGFSLALAGQVWHNAHYAAPATGLLMLLVAAGMKRLRVCRWRGHPIGRCLVQIIPMACVAMLALQVAAGRTEDGVDRSWRWPSAGGVARARILERLERSGEGHLIFVRYGLQHDPGDEWVYNSADIDGSRVVWARELDRFSNARLMSYFSSRQVWLLEPDVSATLVPYRTAAPRPMLFVAIGAPGIESLRSAQEIARKLRAAAGDGPLSCDQWNYYFTQVTGVFGPDVANGCYSGNSRAVAIDFTTYYSWLRQQR